MAQYIGRIKGGRGESTRLGTKSTGMTAEANGWTLGARAEMAHKHLNAQAFDEAEIYLTMLSASRMAQQS